MIGLMGQWMAKRRRANRQRAFDSEYRFISRKLAADPSSIEALSRFPGSDVSNEALDAVLEDHAAIIRHSKTGAVT